MIRNLSKKQQSRLFRILISAVMYAVLLAAYALLGEKAAAPVWLVAFLIPYFIISEDVLRKAFKNIRNGQVFDENFLMAIATIAAFGIGEYSEGLAVMLFYQIGEFFQDLAVERSRSSIAQMMELAPEVAWVEKDGALEEMDPDEVEPGDILVIKPGEKIPLDGVVVEGNSFLDTSALTGESALSSKSAGDEVLSGCINGQGTLRVRVTKAYEDSTVAVILDLVENASEKKARLENFITRFARYYTPVVTILAAILALFPPLFLGASPAEWIRRACVFLIVSCPCALVISVPLGFFCGIAAGSKIGVLVKGGNYLEALARVRAVAFDKTGTVTKGVFDVLEVIPSQDSSYNIAEILVLAAGAEQFSNHPIARALSEAADYLSTVQEVREIPGRGVSCTVQKEGETQKLLVGNARLLEEEGVSGVEVLAESTSENVAVFVALSGVLLGAILLGDEPREDAGEAIAALKKAGIRTVVMLTGDRDAAARKVAEAVGCDEYRAALLPQDKVAYLEQVMARRGSTAFVGDGINDAPVLMRSDVGIAMGAMGSDAAIAAADIVLMHDDLRKIPQIIRIAKKTTRIVRENIVFAIGVKLVVLALGAAGAASMWAAVFADVGVAMLAILNAMRSGRIR